MTASLLEARLLSGRHASTSYGPGPLVPRAARRRRGPCQGARPCCQRADVGAAAGEEGPGRAVAQAEAEEGEEEGEGAKAEDAVVSAQGPAAPEEEDPKQQKQGGWSPWLRGLAQLLWKQAVFASRIFFVFTVLRLLPILAGSWAPPLSWLNSAPEITLQVPFSELLQASTSDMVETVHARGSNIFFKLRAPDWRPPRGGATPFQGPLADTQQSTRDLDVLYKTVRPHDYPSPYRLWLDNRVTFSAEEPRYSWLPSLLSLAVGICTVLAISQWRFGGVFGRKSNRYDAKNATVTFADVQGVDEAKEELAEVVEVLRHPQRFRALGAKPPAGVLLVGPPGTGKTLLARAVAGEAGVAFYSISASEFVELYVGLGASRVRDLYEKARKNAPAIVFIDEIDAVARGRESRRGGAVNDEREQTLNQLLTELDGFANKALGGSPKGKGAKRRGPVITIAATNRADVLDPALLRPGRFDRRVTVPRPDRIGRAAILRRHIEAQALPLEQGCPLEGLATATTGFTGADLANLVNEAALLAGRAGKERVGEAEFDQAILRTIAGVEMKRNLMGALEKLSVARHEAGHALVATALRALNPSQAPVEKLSIVPRAGGALGFTYMPEEERSLLFDCDVRMRLAVLMGGRAAEVLTCDQVSNGAGDDLQRATRLAYQAVADWGLNPVVGPLSVRALTEAGDGGYFGRPGSSVTEGPVHSEVSQLLVGALNAAQAVIRANLAQHARLSAALGEEERLEGPRLQGLLEGVAIPQPLRDFVYPGRGQGPRRQGEAALPPLRLPSWPQWGQAQPQAG